MAPEMGKGSPIRPKDVHARPPEAQLGPVPDAFWSPSRSFSDERCVFGHFDVDKAHPAQVLDEHDPAADGRGPGVALCGTDVDVFGADPDRLYVIYAAKRRVRRKVRRAQPYGRFPQATFHDPSTDAIGDLRRFMAGVPIKVATKVLAGRR